MGGSLGGDRILNRIWRRCGCERLNARSAEHIDKTAAETGRRRDQCHSSGGHLRISDNERAQGKRKEISHNEIVDERGFGNEKTGWIERAANLKMKVRDYP